MPVIMTVPLKERVHAAFTAMWGWGYSRDKPQVPAWLPGMPEKLKEAVAPKTRPGATNCTVAAGWVVLASIPRARDVKTLWLDIQVARGPERPFSPQEGLVAAGLGEEVDVGPRGLTAQGIYVAETWSGLAGGKIVEPSEGQPGSRGHMRILEIGTDGQLRVREASQSRGGVVDRFAPLGAIATWGQETRAVRLAER